MCMHILYVSDLECCKKQHWSGSIDGSIHRDCKSVVEKKEYEEPSANNQYGIGRLLILI